MKTLERIYAFTGENSWQLREEKTRWIRAFEAKYGSDAVLRVSPEPMTTVRELQDAVALPPFLTKKRLVVVEGISHCTKEEAGALVQSIHPDVLLLFVEAKPDKRFGGTKELLEKASVKTFAKLTGKAFELWVRQRASSFGASITPQAVRRLLEYIGEEQDLMDQEIAKLSLFARGRAIEDVDVEALAFPSFEGVLWRLSDSLAAGRKDLALQHAKRMLDRGADAYGLWSMLLSMARSLVMLRAALSERLHSQQEIAATLQLHPFAVRAQLPWARRVSDDALEEFVAWVADKDIQLKTGALRSSDEAPQELHALVDAFLLMSP